MTTIHKTGITTGKSRILRSRRPGARPRSPLEAEVAALARQLMLEHGLVGWSFEFDNAVQRLGQCSWRRRIISISRVHVAFEPAHEVRDTILHEIAHARCGPLVGHDRFWKSIAAAIGATPSSCVSVDPRPHRWHVQCPLCNAQTRAHHRRDSYCWPCYCLGIRIRMTWMRISSHALDLCLGRDATPPLPCFTEDDLVPVYPPAPDLIAPAKEASDV